MVATLTEVYAVIDKRIEQMQQEAAGPCIDALLDSVDRDGYREAIRRGSALKAVQALRAHLTKVLGNGEKPLTNKAAKALRAATQRAG